MAPKFRSLTQSKTQACRYLCQAVLTAKTFVCLAMIGLSGWPWIWDLSEGTVRRLGLAGEVKTSVVFFLLGRSPDIIIDLAAGELFCLLARQAGRTGPACEEGQTEGHMHDQLHKRQASNSGIVAEFQGSGWWAAARAGD